MLFPTFTFTLFFLLTLGVWWGVLRSSTAPRTRQWVLIAASLVFYAWADWRWVGVLVGSATWAWWGGRWCAQLTSDQRAWRWRLTLVVGALVAQLVAWKYTLWLVAERNDLASLWGGAAWTLPEWAYPVGLSFFTFHALALTLAVARRQQPVPSWGAVLCHVAFFPSLLAGPVLRADAVIPRLQQPFVWAEVPWLEGIGRIALGMGFKWVLASQAASWADPVFSGMANQAPDVWWGVHAYALQIFFDFAGYSHMALGVALLLGFRLPENFTQPYQAVSFQDFWRRWHRSLSFFFRDHLYIEAFGGSRHGRTRAMLAAVATMVLSGVWHGASLTFLVWGVWHAGALVLERFCPGRARWPAWLGWLVTFEGVVWGWVWFRADDLTTARGVFAQAWAGGLPWGHWDAWAWPMLAWALVMALVVATEQPLLTGLSRWCRFVEQPQSPRWAHALTTISLGAWAALVMALGPVGVPPFIYNGF